MTKTTKQIRDIINTEATKTMNRIRNISDLNSNERKVWVHYFNQLTDLYNVSFKEFKFNLNYYYHINGCSYYTYKTIKYEMAHNSYFADFRFWAKNPEQYAQLMRFNKPATDFLYE